MTMYTIRSSGIIAVLLVAILLLSGCFAKKIMADDTLQAPAPIEISNRLYDSTVGQLLDQPAEVGEVWLLPTPTPVPNDLFDRVFGKARALLPTIVPIPVQRTERWGTVTVPGLNVRSAPSADAAVIAGLNQNQRIKIEAEQDGWLQVKLDDGITGWSSADYFTVEEIVVSLSTPEPKASAVAAAAIEKGIILADSLNVRSLPDKNGSIVASLGRNDCVDVISEKDGWFQIAMPGAASGWSIGEYIQTADACPASGTVNTYAVGGAVPGSSAGDTLSVAYVEPTPTVPYSAQPMAVNAKVVNESKMHECFGGGWDEVRFVSSNTPVEVLGTGPWSPPPGQEGELGPGPYVKIRIWDGQYGWIAASAVSISFENLSQISGQCEEGDRIDWSTIAKPTPTRAAPPPRATPRPIPTRRPSSIFRPTPIGSTTVNQDDHKYRDE